MKILPKHIKKIAFIAPSGPPDMERVRKASELLKSAGHEIIIKPSVFQKNMEIEYLSSDVQTRLTDIHSCWEDRSIDMVIAVRGGYGSAHLLPFLDWSLLKKRQLPFLGYSDLTAIHLAFYSRGVGTPISGPMIQNFPVVENDEYTKVCLSNAFNKTYEIIPLNNKKFKVLKKGKAIGPIIPVTLSVLVTLIGTEYLPEMKGHILLIEDVNEPVYKIDRYFTQLEQAGILKKISGLLLGNFKKCGNEIERTKLFSQIGKNIRGPIVMGIPFGHTYPRISVAFGAKCSLECESKIPKISIENKR